MVMLIGKLNELVRRKYKVLAVQHKLQKIMEKTTGLCSEMRRRYSVTSLEI